MQPLAKNRRPLSNRAGAGLRPARRLPADPFSLSVVAWYSGDSSLACPNRQQERIATMSLHAEADSQTAPSNTGRVIAASLIGTTIEFYDFYIYGTAAALVIGPVFFPAASPAAQALNAFLTFGIAFLARPIGSALFGHFGDRIGRKATLVASLLVMGLSTTLIGFLPGYASWGTAAAVILCLLRFGQGV